MSLQTDDKTIARKKLTELRRQSSRLVPAAGMTFEKLTEQYLEFIGARGMKPASYPVAILVNKPQNDVPECIQPVVSAA